MLIFNTTFHIHNEINDACILYFQSVYIPQATSNGILREPRLTLVHHQHEEGGCSYALEFRVKDIHALEQWIQTEGQKLQQAMTEKFGDKLAGFTTLLDVVQL